MADLIVVEAVRQDGRVALWERDPAHPEGEIFVYAGGAPVRCARTPGVLRALADQRVREISVSANGSQIDADQPVQTASTPMAAPAAPPDVAAKKGRSK